MINLLPPEEKQILLETKQWKMVLILGFIVFVFFISLALILISVNISISSKVAGQKIILAQKEQGLKTADTNDLKNKIAKINQDLLKLDSFYQKSTSFTGFMEKISNLLPEGIYLDNISINPVKNESNIFQVYLSGRAPSIEDVILLNENLKKDKELSQISFPADTWLQKQDFVFNVSFQAVINK